MNETPEEIRARIDMTREQVSGDVDALAEKVSPTGMVEREAERVKGKVNDVKDRLFGANDHDPGAVGRVGDDVKHTADRAVQKAKGNPLAVGLVAFGVGALIASLIPASDKEKEVAVKVKESAEPVVEGAKDVAKEMGEHLQQPAQDAAQAVKETAQQAGEHVRDEAQSGADDVRADADRARQRVQDQSGS
ncbi:DUF3618 domain-containing protein [Agrococcus beijingensis]|uniref:DUF3618 domain-containing protein n=1 Tax=Agrococcus beijingensis TaxID=3068634 RepID=UPI002742786E|nr:DUF3618 domain-containing protein [Agrococcus sp. REN33]